jgi:hypothetical protein
MHNHSKIHFITFSGGNQTYRQRLDVICNQCKQIPFIDNIVGYTDSHLKQDIPFWQQHGHFIQNNSRGYGYWLWKSYINLNFIDTIDENDIVIYADAGCEFNINEQSLQRLKQYIELTQLSQYGILSFELRRFFEKEYTKSDTINYLQGDDVSLSKQLVGGVFLYKKSNHVKMLFQKWYQASCNYHLLDDSHSIIPNHQSFKEHRHDQSIFSIIRKKYGTHIITDETYWGPDWNVRGQHFPIWAKRSV